MQNCQQGTLACALYWRAFGILIYSLFVLHRSDKSWGESEQPRKTHIVCTLGPASRTIEELSALLRNGMNVARFNMSHGDHAYHTESLENLNEAVRLTGLPCATLLDTKGPEIRTGN